MAEQFAFQKLLGNGRAIDGQKRLLAAIAMMINGPRYQLLARAALAGDERRGIRGGELADEKRIVEATAGNDQLMDSCFGQDEAVERVDDGERCEDCRGANQVVWLCTIAAPQ